VFKAILLDFNGVVVNDEPIHGELYRQLLLERGFDLSVEQYEEHFLGKDDYSIGLQALEMAGAKPSFEEAKALVEEKTRRYVERIEGELDPVKGVAEFMDTVRERAMLGVVSGAPGLEITHVLGLLDLENRLDVFVPLETFDRGKPDPQGYLLGLARLNLDLAGKSLPPIFPHEVLVVEDSKAGFKAGLEAGMVVAALTTSHGPETFPGAFKAVSTLEELLPSVVERLPASSPEWVKRGRG